MVLRLEFKLGAKANDSYYLFQKRILKNNSSADWFH
jgi:hypothetical protein